MNHQLHIEYAGGHTLGDCRCNWTFETTGDDESSRNAVQRAYADHEGA